MKNSLQNLLALSFTFICLAIYGQNPARDLQDIVGVKGRSAEYTLESKGYVHIKTSKSGYHVYSSWWNPSQKKCVTYHLSDGTVQSVATVPPFDCNKSSDAEYSSSPSYNHNSYNHNNNTHHSERDHDMAFERGHSDALYSKAYHNIYSNPDLKNAYSDGYQSGVNQRGYNTQYHSGGGGYQAHARVDDIVGLSVDSAAERMGSRGFTEVNQFKHDGRTHRIYYNRETRQCLDLRSMHGKVGHVENSTKCNK